MRYGRLFGGYCKLLGASVGCIGEVVIGSMRASRFCKGSCGGLLGG